MLEELLKATQQTLAETSRQLDAAERAARSGNLSSARHHLTALLNVNLQVQRTYDVLLADLANPRERAA